MNPVRRLVKLIHKLPSGEKRLRRALETINEKTLIAYMLWAENEDYGSG